MNKILKIFILILLLGSYRTELSAQTAESILNKSISQIENNSLRIIFDIINYDNQKQVTNKTRGSLDLYQNKFKLSTKYITIWFDGKTQWSLFKGSDEVNISTPTGTELQQINPTYLINSYKKNKLELKKVSYQGKQCDEINIIPQKNNNYSKLYIIIDNNRIKNIRMKDKKGIWVQFNINSIQNMKFPSQNFIFNKQNYPHIEINDLR